MLHKSSWFLITHYKIPSSAIKPPTIAHNVYYHNKSEFLAAFIFLIHFPKPLHHHPHLRLNYENNFIMIEITFNTVDNIMAVQFFIKEESIFKMQIKIDQLHDQNKYEK